ncbi:hypothetical protein GQR36_03705 [Enterococcus termitis]
MDENDRRRINVTLTESGKKAAKHEKNRCVIKSFKFSK